MKLKLILMMMIFMFACGNNPNPITPTFENIPPRGKNQWLTIKPNLATTITLFASDPDNNHDEFTFSVRTSPEYGTLIGTPPNMIYTPFENYIGADRFEFSVNDGQDEALSPATIYFQIRD